MNILITFVHRNNIFYEINVCYIDNYNFLDIE